MSKPEFFDTVPDIFEHLNGPDHLRAHEATALVVPDSDMASLRDLRYWHEWIHEQDEEADPDRPTPFEQELPEMRGGTANVRGAQ